MMVSKTRSLLKTISWRIIATATTMYFTWLLSGDISLALGVGAFNVFVKSFLYYAHERIWLRCPFGTKVIDKN